MTIDNSPANSPSATPSSASEPATEPPRPAESRTREYLANERTYLAWMRTATSLMAFGVIIVQIRAFRPPLAAGPGTTWQLGLIFSLVGLVTVFLATQQYFAIRYDIADDSYEPTGRWVILFTIAVTLLGTGVLYYAFSYAPLPASPAP